VQEVFQSGTVRGALHIPEHPNGDALVLAHGAGSNSNAPLLVRVAGAFCEAGYLVLRFDLPFRQQRPKGPPFPAQAAKDREGIAEAISTARGLAARRIFAGGHSYGGRQTAMLAAEAPDAVSALLLLSYPLHPPTRPDEKRTSFFPQLRTPVLFVHGSKDPFGSLQELREAISLIPARTDLLAVDGAGHDLRRAPNLAKDTPDRFRALVCYPEE
jgi:uncharacterized protein